MANFKQCLRIITQLLFNCKNEVINFLRDRPVVVSIVELENEGVSKVNISFSLTNKKNSYTEIVSDYTVPHFKNKSITTGSFPALFIKIECLRGTPISMKGIKVFGSEA